MVGEDGEAMEAEGEDGVRRKDNYLQSGAG